MFFLIIGIICLTSFSLGLCFLFSQGMVIDRFWTTATGKAQYKIWLFWSIFHISASHCVWIYCFFFFKAQWRWWIDIVSCSTKCWSELLKKLIICIRAQWTKLAHLIYILLTLIFFFSLSWFLVILPCIGWSGSFIWSFSLKVCLP